MKRRCSRQTRHVEGLSGSRRSGHCQGGTRGTGCHVGPSCSLPGQAVRILFLPALRWVVCGWAPQLERFVARDLLGPDSVLKLSTAGVAVDIRMSLMPVTLSAHMKSGLVFGRWFRVLVSYQGIVPARTRELKDIRTRRCRSPCFNYMIAYRSVRVIVLSGYVLFQIRFGFFNVL